MAKKRRIAKHPKPVAPKQSSGVIDEAIAAALNSVLQPVPMKMCRLCEAKDGPFLNIFEADKVIEKKVEELMPFGISETDDLPHKICFRCSAKLEELYEFIQKCIKTQESLRRAMGKKGPLVTTQTRLLWEEKLNKTNILNEDICNALVEKALEGMKDITLKPLPLGEEKLMQTANKITKASVEPPVISRNEKTEESDDEREEVPLKMVKLSISKCDDKVTRSSGSKSEGLLEGSVEPKKVKQNSKNSQSNATSVESKTAGNPKETETQQNINTLTVNKNKFEYEIPIKEEPKTVETPPPFNIMDHISTIKVNGVGTLFQCKLCNRNFLKKEVVVSHGCAKNNVPKDNITHNHVPPPEIPKPSTVKYIKMDKDFKRPIATENKPVEKKQELIGSTQIVQKPVEPEVKPKPKIGPASKVKRDSTPQTEPTPPPAQSRIPLDGKGISSIMPNLNMPGVPSLNSRYRIVPGPNNSFTLEEDVPPPIPEKPVPSLNARFKLIPGPNNTFSLIEDKEQNETAEPNVPLPPQPKSRKRKGTDSKVTKYETEVKASHHRINTAERESSPEIIDLDENITSDPPTIQQPYPVGLFQTVPHHSSVYPPAPQPQPPAFTTPAVKKQSYTIVQTGNPSKLLISTKPQPVAEEPPKKKSRKSKPEGDKPYNVTLEDTAPPKDSGFFTFINVDPLLQPSYVLPTDSIIQESQISTSTSASKAAGEKDKEKYACNMCEEKFSREKKLLTHIQQHYKEMDEEDELRTGKIGPKRKTRKS